VDRVFFRETVDYRAALQEFSHELTQTLDLDAVLAQVSKQVEESLHPDRQWACLYDETLACYVGQPIDEGQQTAFPVTFAPDGALTRWLQGHQECLYLPAERELPGELAAEWVRMGALGAMVYVPLHTRERLSGWLALGPKRSGQPYRSDDLAFLSALADQSALAVENARLFASVHRNLAAITEMKNLMDDVFSSIASGVITTDVQDKVTFFNRAAEAILGIRADEIVGRPCKETPPPLGDELHYLVGQVKQSEIPVMAYEVQPELPARGPVWLRMNLSPLKDSHDVTTGVTIVVDDLTERRQLEARVRRIRETFERYVAPSVVERLLSNPESVRLGGARQEITSFYADIRGFTAFGEKSTPESMIEVLNRHLTLATGAILAQEGTLDKFVGDSAVAIFNAPVPQEDHTLRAVRAALAMQQAMREHHAQVDERERLHFGIGITVGEAVVGNIGSVVVQNFTAIGDCVNFSCRLSDIAGPGQILISAEAYERVKDHIAANSIGHVQVKGHSQPDPVYEVVGFRPVDQ
jgi:PAS domain S-box-containing protein